MTKKSYKWLERLIDKITRDDCPNNNSFNFYGHQVDLQSGTRDFTDVHIYDKSGRWQTNFSFDFWTKELDFSAYTDYDERDTIIKAFRSIYQRIRIGSDEPWQEKVRFYEPMIDNDEYDQESIMQEYNNLMARKAA